MLAPSTVLAYGVSRGSITGRQSCRLSIGVLEDVRSVCYRVRRLSGTAGYLEDGPYIWGTDPVIGDRRPSSHGVLFLDELGEFPVAALESLRQPLEEGVIRVSRAAGTAEFPASFLLVAAMNPCPCGEGVYEGACSCSVVMRARYRRRISAPFLDRFDLVVPVTRPTASELLDRVPAESSADVAARVAMARNRADSRGPQEPVLTKEATDTLSRKLAEGELSARGLGKVTRVARTIADLAEAEVVNDDHVSEALLLRAGRSVVVA